MHQKNNHHHHNHIVLLFPLTILINLAKVESARVGALKEVGVNVTEVLVAECRNPDRTIKVGFEFG